MNSISKKIFLVVIAGVAVQAGNSAYGASQLGGLYKSGATVALENVAKAFKSAGNMMRNISKDETIQLMVGAVKNSSQEAKNCALFSSFLAASSIWQYRLYRDALIRAEKEKEPSDDEQGVWRDDSGRLHCGPKKIYWLERASSKKTGSFVFGVLSAAYAAGCRAYLGQ
ncbi:MAG TPA: hypothetical protein VGT41_01800 [Candidatus Babeliales bacterium]|nr:hypothetical protein [Candidatus Babeliales bacterium]